jgi:hypothetical protein
MLAFDGTPSSASAVVWHRDLLPLVLETMLRGLHPCDSNEIARGTGMCWLRSAGHPIETRILHTEVMLAIKQVMLVDEGN